MYKVLLKPYHTYFEHIFLTNAVYFVGQQSCGAQNVLSIFHGFS